MSDIPHIGFIVAAYAVTAVAMLAMVLFVFVDGRTQRRLLTKLEGRADGRQGRAYTDGISP